MAKNTNRNAFESPLPRRYSSKEMSYIFSEDFKFRSWRKLWIALAEGQHELGLPVTKAQIGELKKFADNINYSVAEKRELETRHDVMSHIYAYGKQCPKARPIIHLGATSAYVADNTDLIQLRAGLELIRKSLVNVMAALAGFAREHSALPTLGYTHFQTAQLTTVGKRAALWLQDLVLDLREIESCLADIPFLGVKGATGTQASFLSLFKGDKKKVKRLDEIVAKKIGFAKLLKISGQTYTRKIDSRVLNVLSGIAQSAHKFSNDMRLLQHIGEIMEPFGKQQIGSSAMPYKRNPMRSERIGALSRFVIQMALNPAQTAAEQWLERTLDDSANKRLAVPEAFLAVDALLLIYHNIASGIIVRPRVIAHNVANELPFIAAENVLMEAVSSGGDRQELHERIRRHSLAAAAAVKEEGKPNDLLERLANDAAFKAAVTYINKIRAGLQILRTGRKSDKTVMQFVGRAPEQVSEFLVSEVGPLLRKYRGLIGGTSRLRV